jgi:hypothetical protein
MTDKKPPTIDELLSKSNAEMDRILEHLQKDGAPNVSLAFHSLVLRPAYDTIIRAQYFQTPVAEIDEAIVGTIASLLFDYLVRIHAKQGGHSEALDHLGATLEDVAERVGNTMQDHYAPGLIVPTSKH